MQSQILSQIAELETMYAEALGNNVPPSELNKIYIRIKKLQALLSNYEEDDSSREKGKKA